MKKSGLTLSIIFEAESANYGEGLGNITQLKKMSRGDGNAYTYISRQAIRYNIVRQLGWDSAESIAKDATDKKSVVQFAPNATITDYPEIDLFGYMKTFKKKEDASGGADKRSAVARLSNAISLESFKSETDFLTNMGMANRIGVDNSIAQSEIHKSFYAYTVTVDLDIVGVDGAIELPMAERAARVKALMSALESLYRDIKGRRENLAPVFVIGGTYGRKNPFFENRLSLRAAKLDIDRIKEVAAQADSTGTTAIGYLSGSFANDGEIKDRLKPVSITEFFARLSAEVDNYYA